MSASPTEEGPWPFFRFDVSFAEYSLAPGASRSPLSICSGAFSECTGLDASMEPKVIREGGRNDGAIQRTGPVSYSTVILKRGMTSSFHLFRWFEQVAGGAYSHRMDVTITVRNSAGQPLMAWLLRSAFPIKYRAADLNAKNSEVSVEELHLAHEGLSLSRGIPGGVP